MTKYAVWSTHVVYAPRDSKDPAAPAVDRLEVTRTDRKVAEEDVKILKDILHRRSWLVEHE
jgi:hypothetical protein